MDTKSRGFKTVIGIIIISLGYLWNTFQTDKQIAFQESPTGSAQILANIELEKIKACSNAAEKGVLGPGCQAMPNRPTQTTQMIIPSPFSTR